MKKLITLLSAVIVCACAKQVAEQGEGTVSLNVTSDLSLTETSKSNVGDYTQVPAIGDFNLSLYNYAHQPAWEGKYKDWNPEMKFMSGEYTAKIYYGSAEEEGKDKPSFEAEQTFNIIAFENTPVTLKPALSNCIIRLKEGNYLKNYFSKREYSITTAAGNTFSLGEKDAIFIDAYKFTLKASFTGASGKTTEMTKTFEGLKPANCYTIDVELSNVGGIGFTITFNDLTETITIEEELSI